MFSQRLLKVINLSIAVLVIAVAIATWWFVWRSLPETSGGIPAPITAPATVTRDAIGVPHIVAATVEDALFLQGFVTAQDRLWQMDALRRLAAGELAEVVGPVALASDQESRQLRMRRAAEEHYRTMSAADRAVLVAYTRGVNHFIETHRGRYGLEFALLNYDPRPWSAVDSILAGMQMFRSLTTTWKLDLQRQVLRENGDAAKVRELFPVRSGMEITPGSNAWVIGGAHTASGKPILANDPHLEFSNPSTWYQVHLKAPGLNATGVSLPGVPAVIIGHNERIAWGITNLHFDVQDLYVERLDQQSGRYVFRGKVEQARLEREVILVKGGKSVGLNIWVTGHGPVLVGDNGRSYSLRWTAIEPGGFQFPFLDIDQARNWDDFNAALKRMPGPGSNMVYADVDGNIGYHAAGNLPVRRDFDGDEPLDGTSGNAEWDGVIPYEQLPAAYNPPSGLIVTANQNPFSKDFVYRVGGDFGPHYRSQQIRQMLGAHNGWKPSDMLTIEKDVYSAFSKFLAQQTVEAYDRLKSTNPALAPAVELLRAWDGQMDKDHAAPMVATMIFQHVRTAIAERASPKQGGNYAFQMAPVVIERLLHERPKGWFPDWDRMLVKAFADGVEEGAQLQGGNPKAWQYGKYNELTIAQPVDSHLPLVGSYFNIGPVYMSGSSTTVKQTTRRMGPSMRFVADFSDWEASLNNITIGQSGHYFSSHFKDQWKQYYYAQSFPMQFGRVEAKQVLEVRPAK